MTVYQVVQPSVVVISHFLILSSKPIGTALGSSCFYSCLKAGTGNIGLVLILMVSDQWTYTSLHHNTPCFWHLADFLIFPDRGVASLCIDSWGQSGTNEATETHVHIDAGCPRRSYKVLFVFSFVRHYKVLFWGGFRTRGLIKSYFWKKRKFRNWK